MFKPRGIQLKYLNENTGLGIITTWNWIMRTEKGYEPCCMTPTVAHTHATLLHGYPRDCLSRIALSRPGYPLAIRRDVPGAFHHESMFQTPSPPRRPTPTIPIGAIACMRETRTTAVPVLEAELNRCVHGREGRGAPSIGRATGPRTTTGLDVIMVLDVSSWSPGAPSSIWSTPASKRRRARRSAGSATAARCRAPGATFRRAEPQEHASRWGEGCTGLLMYARGKATARFITFSQLIDPHPKYNWGRNEMGTQMWNMTEWIQAKIDTMPGTRDQLEWTTLFHPGHKMQ